jgi:hypothetical protein
MLVDHPNLPPSVLGFLCELAGNAAVEELILFGSRAFGDHDDRSDADIAVRGSLITPLAWARIKDAASNSRSLFWISLVHFDRNPSQLQLKILETGVRIYVRTQTA